MQFFKSLSGDRTVAKEMLFEKIMIDYFRRGQALCKEYTNDTDPTPFLQPSSFNAKMKSSHAELKEHNVNFNYEKDWKAF